MSCLVIQPVSMDQNISRRLSTEYVQHELTQKRKALDKEIERFMAQKDAEFRRFEKDLKSHVLQHDQNEAPEATSSKAQATIVSRGFTVGAVPTTPTQERQVSDAQTLQSPSDTTSSADTNSTNGFSRQPIDRTLPARRNSNEDKREFELAALFPSSYLPLLDAGHATKDESDALSTDDSPRISTSLSTHDSLAETSRPQMHDRRSSSSPTGTGRSLRKSSLKRPDSRDSNKERKHVLFSIDNQVISPKSSPATVRSLLFQNPPIPFSGLRDLTFEQSNASTEQLIDMTSVAPPVLQPPLHVSTTASSISRSYKDLLVPTVITPPEELEHEDLHFAAKDPLFGADEPPALLNEDEWDLSPVGAQSDDEDELIAASPHVGSLPIQIRPQSRR